MSNLFKISENTIPFLALNNINLTVEKGETVGIIGHNGAGKSTLFKILSKITYPTKGIVEINGRLSSLLEVGTGFHPELTGIENIFLNGALLGMTKKEINTKLDEIIQFSGVERFIHTPIKHFSSGMYVRLAFSVAAHLNTDILLLDEILSVGDTEFQNKCLNKIYSLKNEGCTILFISHQLSSIKSMCDRAILLKNGEIKADGNVTQVINQYLKNDISNYKIYKNESHIKRILITTLPLLKLTLEYDLKNKGEFPHFGFIIYDNNGYPIFGGNPYTEGLSIPAEIKNSGTIEVEVLNPTLTSGEYNLSIWLSSEYGELFEDHNCLKFKIENTRESHLGFIKPKLNFSYT